MGFRASKDVPFFLINGYDVVGDLTEIEDEGLQGIIQEKATFGTSWATHEFTGIRTWGLTQRGFYNDAAGQLNAALATGPGVSRVLCYGLEGTATGAAFMGAAGAMQIDYKRIFTRNELSKAEAAYRGNGPVDFGKTVRTQKTITATGATTGTPLDGLASSTGGVAYLQWRTGNGDANMRLLHSSDNITYAALFTFTKTNGGFGAERLTTTGVIERYTAFDLTTASATGPSPITNMWAFMGLSRGYSS